MVGVFCSLHLSANLTRNKSKDVDGSQAQPSSVSIKIYIKMNVYLRELTRAGGGVSDRLDGGEIHNINGFLLCV